MVYVDVWRRQLLKHTKVSLDNFLPLVHISLHEFFDLQSLDFNFLVFLSYHLFQVLDLLFGLSSLLIKYLLLHFMYFEVLVFGSSKDRRLSFKFLNSFISLNQMIRFGDFLRVVVILINSLLPQSLF